MLVALGYDPALAPDRIQITTGSGVEFAPRVVLQKITALGLERTAFPVLGHTLPPSAAVDGLLGLDFFRGHVLTIDFRAGRVDVVSPIGSADGIPPLALALDRSRGSRPR